MLPCPATRQMGCGDSWMQSLLHTLLQDCMVANSTKAEVLYLPSDSSLPPTFFISGDQLGLNEQFTYLWSIVTSACDLTEELQRRFHLASASSGDCTSAFSQTVTFLHAPRWPFTVTSASRHCSLLARDGHRTVVTSKPSRLFKFVVFKLFCTCTDGRTYLLSRADAENRDVLLSRLGEAEKTEKHLFCHNCYNTTNRRIVLTSCLADTRRRHRKLDC